MRIRIHVTAPPLLTVCVRAFSGYNTMGHYMRAANAIAREVVEGHGFEVFDPSVALIHASPQWYDLNGKDALHSDPISDLITQMLINQICDEP